MASKKGLGILIAGAGALAIMAASKKKKNTAGTTPDGGDIPEEEEIPSDEEGGGPGPGGDKKEPVEETLCPPGWDRVDDDCFFIEDNDDPDAADPEDIGDWEINTPAKMRAAYRELGYTAIAASGGSIGKSAPSKERNAVKQFQADYNAVSKSIKKGIVLDPKLKWNPNITGTLATDGISGASTISALEKAVLNKRNTKMSINWLWAVSKARAALGLSDSSAGQEKSEGGVTPPPPGPWGAGEKNISVAPDASDYKIGGNYAKELAAFVWGERAMGKSSAQVIAAAFSKTGSRARYAMWNGNHVRISSLPNTAAMQDLKKKITALINEFSKKFPATSTERMYYGLTLEDLKKGTWASISLGSPKVQSLIQGIINKVL
jgi:hypothetical protein